MSGARARRLAPLLLTGAALTIAAGCKRPLPGTEERALAHGGFDRTYYLHTPPDLEGQSGPHPLVVALHGRLGDGVQQESMTGLSDVGDREGFLVAYPNGVDRSWNDGRPGGPANEQDVDDVGFLAALIDDVVANDGADPARVFVTGMSNGSMMTHRFACERAERVAAIATIAGPMPELVEDACAPKRPVPSIQFDGTDDPIVPYEGGELARGAGGVMLSSEATGRAWAERNGCGPTPTSTDLPDEDTEDGTRVRRDDYTGCTGGAEVQVYVVKEGGHTWPGGDQYLPVFTIGRTTRDVDATELAWAFFARHAPSGAAGD